jgi:hypothetical protein
VPPRGPNSGQNGRTARVVAHELARDASARQPLFSALDVRPRD